MNSNPHSDTLMGSAFDKEDDGDVIETRKRSPRPKDAATLILVRRDTTQPRVLMGKRSAGHAFMPEKYVFPGGRVDPQDGKAVSYCEFAPQQERLLRIQTRRKPRAFGLTPLTFIGRAITPPYRPKRFDARFFMANAEEALIDERPPVDGAELSDLQWVTLKDALALDLPNVTRFMLGEIEERLDKPSLNRGPPFLRWTRSGHSTDRL